MIMFSYRKRGQIVYIVDYSRYKKSDNARVDRLNENIWSVKCDGSQNRHRVEYVKNKFKCLCNDAVHRKTVCKHITSVLRTAETDKIRIEVKYGINKKTNSKRDSRA